MLVAILLAFAMLPALALGTGTYVRSTTGTELQRASDSGALAGSAEIPLGDLNFAESYLSKITGTGVTTTLADLGIQNAANLPDPLVDACATALRDANNTHNLGHAYAGTPSCTAKYLANDSVLSDAQTCVNSIAGLGGLTGGLLGGLGGLLGGLGLGALDPTKLLTSLEQALPALLEPGVSVTMTWHVDAPFDQVFASDGHDQTTTSYARRRFKNAVVLPNIPLGGTTVNVDPTLQLTRSVLLSTLNTVEGVLTTLNPIVPGIASCATALDDLSGDVADLVDPPSGGPSLDQILADAAASGSPVLAVSTTVVGLGIPFLDMVPVCISDVNGQYVAHLTSFGSCIINAPGAFRGSLRNS